MDTQNKVDLIEKLVHASRVSKTVKGGRTMSFTVLAVVGDGQGRCGIAKGKASEAPGAARKAVRAARKNMVKIPLYEGRTLHHDVKASFGKGKVLLRAASPGTGIIAGGVMRSLLESLGVQDVVCKSMTSNNPHSVLRATMKALESSLVPRAAANQRRVKLSNILSRRHQSFGEASTAEKASDENSNAGKQASHVAGENQTTARKHAKETTASNGDNVSAEKDSTRNQQNSAKADFAEVKHAEQPLESKE